MTSIASTSPGRVIRHAGGWTLLSIKRNRVRNRILLLSFFFISVQYLGDRFLTICYCLGWYLNSMTDGVFEFQWDALFIFLIALVMVKFKGIVCVVYWRVFFPPSHAIGPFPRNTRTCTARSKYGVIRWNVVFRVNTTTCYRTFWCGLGSTVFCSYYQNVLPNLQYPYFQNVLKNLANKTFQTRFSETTSVPSPILNMLWTFHIMFYHTT